MPFMRSRRCLLAAALALAACDGGEGGRSNPPPAGRAIIRGALSTRLGDQSVSAGLGVPADVPGPAGSTTASVVAVGPKGATAVLARADVADDGTFEIDGVPAIRGPFLVQTSGPEGLTGQVLVPDALGDGEARSVQPVSRETTVEAEAWLTLLAVGIAPGDIDAVGLMSRISAEMAAHAARGADLAAPAYDAQKAELATLRALLGARAPDAATLASARLGPWATLRARLAVGADDADAWRRFSDEVVARLEQRYDLPGRPQLAAIQAARCAFLAALDLREASVVRAHAEALGALLAGRVARAVALETADGDEPAVRSQIEALYQLFEAALGAASAPVDVARAELRLAAGLAGYGRAAGGSILQALLDRMGTGTAHDLAEQTLATVLDAALALGAEIDRAYKLPDAADRIASAHAVFVDSVERTFTQVEGTGIPPGSAALLTDLALAVPQQLPAAIVVSAEMLPADVLVGPISARNGDVGPQIGAFGLVAGDPEAAAMPGRLAAAVTAVLYALGDDGRLDERARGRVDARGYFVIEGTGDLPPLGAVHLVGSDGAVRGAVLLRAALAGPFGTYRRAAITRPITVESTLEAQLFEAIAQAAGPRAVDAGLLAALVDGPLAAVAYAHDTDDDVLTAFLGAQAVRAAMLDVPVQALSEAADDALTALDAALGDPLADLEAAHTTFDRSITAAVAVATGIDADRQGVAMARAVDTFVALLAALGGPNGPNARFAGAQARMRRAIAAASALHGNAELVMGGGVGARLEDAAHDVAVAIATARTASAFDAADLAFTFMVLGDGRIGDGFEGAIERHLARAADPGASTRAAIGLAWAAAARMRAQIAHGIDVAAEGAIARDHSIDAARLAVTVQKVGDDAISQLEASVHALLQSRLDAAEAGLVMASVRHIASGLYGADIP